MAIVKMSHLTLLAAEGERDPLIRRLMHLGCVELRQLRGGDGLPEAFEAVRAASSQARADYQLLRQAMEYMKQCGVSFPLLQKRQRVMEKALLSEGRFRKAMSMANVIAGHGRAMEQARREISRLKERRAALEHWLECPVALDNTGTANTRLLLGTLPAKGDFNVFAAAIEEAAPESEAFSISRSKERVYGAVLYHTAVHDAVQETLRLWGFRPASFQGLHGTAAVLMEEAAAEMAALEEDMVRRRELIASCGARRAELELALDQAYQRVLAEEGKERGMGDGAVLCFQGWIPTEQLPRLAEALAPFACAYQAREVEEDETPPTLLKNPGWMRPINVVTEMYSLPDYRGIDPNPLIFGFYIFFFGFMFADVAYGLILLAVALFAIRRWDPRGAVGQLLHLGVYLGISTAVCGALTGGFFGNAIEVAATTFFGVPMEELPLWVQRFSAGLVFNPLTSPMAVLYTTLAIGVLQLLFGQLVHIYMEGRSGHLLGGLMDTVPWWVFFAGIALWLFDRGVAVLLAGVVLLILTQGRHGKSFFAKLTGGVASLYGVTNWLSDVLSYSRLMALMLATSVIATVINTLGALPGSLIAFVPVFLVGHLFNIAVNLIGTYVHAARLQYLEFYGKFYKEGGVPFRPLAYQTNYTDVIKEDDI